MEVNPMQSAITGLADIWIEAPAGEALPKIVEAVQGLINHDG